MQSLQLCIGVLRLGGVAAQRTVKGTESQLEAAQARLVKLDAVQDHAVEVLARKIANGGHGRRANPFAPFGCSSPSVIARLPLAEEPDAVGRLVAAVLRNAAVGKEMIEAAQAADKAARAVRQALGPVAKLEASIQQARQKRDAIGQAWESALAALRRGARAAADDGAPDLHATLFPSPTTRASSKTKPAQDAPAESPTAATTSNAA